jgi:hypothetical protein
MPIIINEMIMKTKHSLKYQAKAGRHAVCKTEPGKT